MRVTNIARGAGLRRRDHGTISTPRRRARSPTSPAPATLNGLATGVTVVGSLITADYSTHLRSAAAGRLRRPALPGHDQPARSRWARESRTRGVVYWNNPQQTASASVSIDVGGMPGVGAPERRGLARRRLRQAARRQRATRCRTGSSTCTGTARCCGRSSRTRRAPTASAACAPSTVATDRYELRFRAPDAGPSTASLGIADSPYTNGPQRISDIVGAVGQQPPEPQPADRPRTASSTAPSIARRSPARRCRLLNASGAAALPSTLLRRPGAAGPGHARRRLLQVRSELLGCGLPERRQLPDRDRGARCRRFTAGYSQLIPPTSDASTPPLSVPTCPGSADDAVPGTLDFCEAQASEFAPPPSVQARTPGTNYYLHLTLDSSRVPGTSQIYNNHIPLDPVLSGARRDHQDDAVDQRQPRPARAVRDRPQQQARLEPPGHQHRRPLPAGFRYVEGSARIDGVPAEPTVNGHAARLEPRRRAGLRPADPAAPARGRRRRQRGRVREPRAGASAR